MVTVILLGLGGGPVQIVTPLEVSQSSDSPGTSAEPQPRGQQKEDKVGKVLDSLRHGAIGGKRAVIAVQKGTFKSSHQGQ